jgi:hypothetical protein
MNLVVNARDAMPHGGSIIIYARAETLAEDNQVGALAGDYVRMSLADTGQGMDEATLAQAVEPFFTTKGVGKGTGLGLAMVHGVAEQSGGKLKLESKPGAGTTASLWLPVAAAEQDGARDAQATTKEIPVITAVERPIVLVVDDDALVRVSTCAMLEDIGYGVIEVEDAFHARGNRKSGPHQHPADRSGNARLDRPATRGGRKKTSPSTAQVAASGYAELPKDSQGILRRLAKPYRLAELLDAIAAGLEQGV